MKEKYLLYIPPILALAIIIAIWLMIDEALFALILSLVLVLLIGLYHSQISYQKNKRSLEKKRFDSSYASLKNNTINIAQFIALSDIIDRGLLFIDAHGIIKHVNPLFNQYVETTVHIETSISVLKPHKTLYQIIKDSVEQQKPLTIKMNLDEKHYDVATTPIFEKDKFKGTIVVMHDITELKTAETFQKQFTADVSHELKTPLTTIKGLAEILNRDDDTKSDTKKELLKVIYDESTRMENILSDLLIISKMDRLDYELKRVETDIKLLIEEVVALLTKQAHEKQIKIKCAVDSQLLYVDKTKIQQVMLNLIKNAINYTDSGTITIIGKAKQSVFTIDVIDTGIGIPLEEQDKIFKRFYRLDEARSRASGGSGLGLSIIKNVVKKHQGNIRLTSELDVGSHFSIDLPLQIKK